MKTTLAKVLIVVLLMSQIVVGIGVAEANETMLGIVPEFA